MERSVSVRFKAENVGRGVAPVAFGLHPYWAVSSRTNIRVKIPSRHMLSLLEGFGIPEDPAIEIDAGDWADNKNLDLSRGLDIVFSRLLAHSAEIIDSKIGRKIIIDCDQNFRHFVLYADGRNPFLCLEPWTGGLGGYSYPETGGGNAGNQISMLKPGADFTAEVRFRTERISAGCPQGGRVILFFFGYR